MYVPYRSLIAYVVRGEKPSLSAGSYVQIGQRERSLQCRVPSLGLGKRSTFGQSGSPGEELASKKPQPYCPGHWSREHSRNPSLESLRFRCPG